MRALDLNVSDLTHRITVRVRGLRAFGVRCWIAGWVFRLGAAIAGVNIEIATDGDA